MGTTKNISDIIDVLTPLISFLLGLFFPQVKISGLIDGLRPTHRHDNSEKKG